MLIKIQPGFNEQRESIGKTIVAIRTYFDADVVPRKTMFNHIKMIWSKYAPNEQVIDGDAGADRMLPVTRSPGKQYRDLAIVEADYLQNCGGTEEERLGSIAERSKGRRSTGGVAEPVGAPAKPSTKQPKKRRGKERLDGAGEQSDDPEARPPPCKKLRTLSDSKALPDSIRPDCKTVKRSKELLETDSHTSFVPGGVPRSDVWKSTAAGTSKDRTQRAAIGETSPSKRIEYGELELFRKIVDQAADEKQSEGEHEEDTEKDGEEDEA
ncbi:hypothetical protein B0A48_10746 [Cryoendolithus antarcticus]|uniref:Uncharacterized protein n=1 Tax=Cryoendolithus antarcticus TaxID=1507870 RepID=A0A1V8SYA8_9PEZI|nr:hypothetical protein B0A48_10746 [Cryoendolithus antarcticus]